MVAHNTRLLMIVIVAFSLLLINFQYFSSRTNTKYVAQNTKYVYITLNNTINLSIGILSAPRSNHADYVYRTVAAIARELKNTPFARDFVKKVIVFNPREGRHKAFDKARSEYEYDAVFDFVEANLYNETAMSIKEYPGRHRTMRGVDIQQNIDASGLFDTVLNKFCHKVPNGYMYLMEDDFEMCPFAFLHLYRAISAAEFQYFPNFSALRTSFGFNGVVIHCHDVKATRDYLFNNMQEGPPDAMTSPWWTKYEQEGKDYFGSRRNCAYRHNILDHIGDHSAVWDRKSEQRGRFPRCYDDLYFNGLSHEDWFDGRCRTKEFSPCDNKNIGPSMLSMLRAIPEFDPDFQMPPTVDSIKILNGSVGEDCNAACQREGLKCARFGLPLINRCATLKKHFPCKDCVSHHFGLPSAVSRSPMMNSEDRMCYESHILSEMRCDGVHKTMYRLCTCYEDMPEPVHYCIETEEAQVRTGPCSTYASLEKLYKNDGVTPMSGEIESCDNTWIEIGANRYVEAKAIGKCPKGISQADFEATTPELKHDKAQLYIHHLNAAMIEADINTCIRRAAFIAQMGHESGGFNAFISMLYDSDYNKELGNNEPGDGAKFRGRGPLQMKGRKNYREASDALGVDFLKNPELVETRQWGFRVAAFLWKKNNLNAFADTGREEDYDRITYALNYGYHGKPDRDFRFRIAQRALEC